MRYFIYLLFSISAFALPQPYPCSYQDGNVTVVTTCYTDPCASYSGGQRMYCDYNINPCSNLPSGSNAYNDCWFNTANDPCTEDFGLAKTHCSDINTDPCTSPQYYNMYGRAAEQCQGKVNSSWSDVNFCEGTINYGNTYCNETGRNFCLYFKGKEQQAYNDCMAQMNLPELNSNNVNDTIGSPFFCIYFLTSLDELAPPYTWNELENYLGTLVVKPKIQMNYAVDCIKYTNQWAPFEPCSNNIGNDFHNCVIDVLSSNFIIEEGTAVEKLYSTTTGETTTGETTTGETTTGETTTGGTTTGGTTTGGTTTGGTGSSNMDFNTETNNMTNSENIINNIGVVEKSIGTIDDTGYIIPDFDETQGYIGNNKIKSGVYFTDPKDKTFEKYHPLIDPNDVKPYSPVDLTIYIQNPLDQSIPYNAYINKPENLTTRMKFPK